MKNRFRLCLLILSLTIISTLQVSHPSQASNAPAAFKAGLAKIVITPDKPVRMAGYASRNKLSEGKMHDLHTKALAIADTQGNRVVIITTEYPDTIQIFQIGDLKLVVLAGEVVTDYLLRLKKELGSNTWVAGYSNDLYSYIPSARMFAEGGYEVVDSMIYYDLPGSYAPVIEEKIIGKVHELAQKLEAKPSKKN